MMELKLRTLAAIAALALVTAPPASAAGPDRAFVGDHCTSCHNDADKKGRLDLTSLAFDPNDPANLAVWVRVHDRVTAGEMPPRSRPRPEPAKQKAFVEGLAKSIVAAERVIYKINGLNTSFSELMGLPDGLLDTAYWLPWYNNMDLDTQLRFGVP